jgi:hypothetical protein
MRRRNNFRTSQEYDSQGGQKVRIVFSQGSDLKGLCLTDGPYFQTVFPYDRNGKMTQSDDPGHPLHLVKP